MPRCCSTSAYGEFFDEKLARRDADGYRKHGLRGAGKRLVEMIAARGVDGADVLEVGGGIGALQLELLQRGAARTTNAELSPAYERDAAALLVERSLTQHVDRRIADIVTDPDAVPPADVVLLHRVVCCYPDYEGLLGSAARKAGRLLAFSFPPDLAVARAAMLVLNLWPRLRGCDFRSYVHPEREMLAAAERNGFRVVCRERSGIWRIALLERAS
jgi:hypothetical protein